MREEKLSKAQLERNERFEIDMEFEINIDVQSNDNHLNFLRDSLNSDEECLSNL